MFSIIGYIFNEPDWRVFLALIRLDARGEAARRLCFSCVVTPMFSCWSRRRDTKPNILVTYHCVSPKRGERSIWYVRRLITFHRLVSVFRHRLSSRRLSVRLFQVFSCGVGECVGGDGRDRKQAAPVPSLAGFPTVWMACGNSHSVVIGAGGDALGFGLNTHGQVSGGRLDFALEACFQAGSCSADRGGQ